MAPLGLKILLTFGRRAGKRRANRGDGGDSGRKRCSAIKGDKTLQGRPPIRGILHHWPVSYVEWFCSTLSSLLNTFLLFTLLRSAVLFVL